VNVPICNFGDVSLRDMSLFPQSLESFQRISRVGEMKLERHGDSFGSISYAEKNQIAEIEIPSVGKISSDGWQEY
jgi:hypothetical protein